MLYVLMGEDDFSIRLALDEITKGIGDQTLLSANTAALDGQKLTLDQLRMACETVPFLAEKRLVIVDGLLERFEPRGKFGQKKAKLSDQQTDHKVFSTYLAKIPVSAVAVLVDGKIASSNPLLKSLATTAKVREFPLLKGDSLKAWIQKCVSLEGGSISLSAAELLAGLVGGDLWLMASEIKKLLMYTAGRRVEEADVKQLVSYAQEANIFTMVNAVLEYKPIAASKLLQKLLQDGAAPAYILTMLTRQARMLVLAKDLKKQGKSEAEIMNKIGLKQDWALRKTLEQAQKYSWERLKEIYSKLLETDLSIKTGKYEEELALDILISELCQKGST